eukprot:602152-Prorocentrum_minimum.AAC.1
MSRAGSGKLTAARVAAAAMRVKQKRFGFPVAGKAGKAGKGGLVRQVGGEQRGDSPMFGHGGRPKAKDFPPAADMGMGDPNSPDGLWSLGRGQRACPSCQRGIACACKACKHCGHVLRPSKKVGRGGGQDAEVGGRVRRKFTRRQQKPARSPAHGRAPHFAPAVEGEEDEE